MEEAEFVKTMSRIVHSQGEKFRPFFEEAINLIKKPCEAKRESEPNSE